MDSKLIVLVSFAAGTGFGYFLAVKILENKFEERLEEAFNDIYARLIDEAKEEAEELVKSAWENSDDQTADDQVVPAGSKLVRSSLYSTMKNPYEEAKSHVQLIDYTDYSNEEVEEESTSSPFISKHEYHKDNGYEKLTLYFYKEDGILADEEDGEVDIPYTIGNLAYDVVTVKSERSYVRNDKTQCDFDIVVVEGSFPYGNDEDSRRRRHEE